MISADLEENLKQKLIFLIDKKSSEWLRDIEHNIKKLDKNFDTYFFSQNSREESHPDTAMFEGLPLGELDIADDIETEFKKYQNHGAIKHYQCKF